MNAVLSAKSSLLRVLLLLSTQPLQLINYDSSVAEQKVDYQVFCSWIKNIVSVYISTVTTNHVTINYQLKKSSLDHLAYSKNKKTQIFLKSVKNLFKTKKYVFYFLN